MKFMSELYSIATSTTGFKKTIIILRNTIMCINFGDNWFTCFHVCKTHPIFIHIYRFYYNITNLYYNMHLIFKSKILYHTHMKVLIFD